MPSIYDEIWITAANGSSLCALINGDQGVLMYMREFGDAGFTSRNPRYTGSPTATVEYRLSNGQVDEYPAAWAVPIDDVQLALQYFGREGKQPPFITWHED
jgi:hypothetical protein